MSAGVSLFFDALGQLWQRRRDVLPVLAAPLGVLLILEFGIFAAEPDVVWPYVLYFAVSFVIGAWIAVFWHRYMLLNETPFGFLPPWQNRLVWPYALVGVLIGLLMFTGIFVLLIPTLFVFSQFEDTPLFWSIIVALSLVPGFYLSFRFGLVLPHLALGRGWLGFGESWSKTSGMGIGLWVLTALYVLVLSLPDFMPLIEEGPGGLLISLISAIIYIIGSLIGILILTRLYEYSGLMASENGEIL